MSERWGGVYDVVVRRDPDDALDDHARSVLTLADPDLVLWVDRALSRCAWEDDFRRMRLQPFEARRVARGDEFAFDFGSMFRESPFREDEEEAIRYVGARVADGWRRVAMNGLGAATSNERGGSQRRQTLVARSARALSARGFLGRHLLFAGNDLAGACHFWSLRALGARVRWLPLAALDDHEAYGRSRVAYVAAPALGHDELASRLATLNARPGWRLASSAALLAGGSRSPSAPTFAQRVVAVAPMADALHVAVPTPDITRAVDAVTGVVIEHRLRSLQAGAPDGLRLSPDERTRRLLASGGDTYTHRVTTFGMARRAQLGMTALARLPVIDFRAAVAAPLEQAGYDVALSDKGRFQQQMLVQARGLRYLAWTLFQGDSRRLLELFDEHHVPNGRMTDSYRRSAMYADLRERLYTQLRASGRLTASRRARADQWLKTWADGLLARGMLVAGYHLKCPVCANGQFYAAAEVDERFRCARCATESIVPADSARRLRLGELLHVLRSQHGDVVTGVLSWLRSTAVESLLYLPECDLTHRGGAVETDFAALLDGRLVLGEAKSNDTVRRVEVDRLAAAARRAGAAFLIFATLGEPSASEDVDCLRDPDANDDAWDDTSRRHIQRARHDLAPRGITVMTLSRRELVQRPAARMGELGSPPDARAD